LVPGYLAGQTIFGLRGGIANVDLSGEGDGFVAGAHLDKVISRGWFVRGAVTVLFFENDLGEAQQQLFPEVSIGKRTRIRSRITPYLGVGIGVGASLAGSDDPVSVLQGFFGLEARIGTPWAVALEVLGRAVDPWRGSTMGATLGISRRF